eukprot:m.64058 g.64058  ORF g.64058 m.64058 type:complete len:59 (-) comp9697_c0_seq1:7-183(-)
MVRLPPPTPSFSRVVAAFWAAPATASAIASIAIALGQQLQMQRDLSREGATKKNHSCC